MIAVHLSRQQALYADPRAIQQIKFTANLDRAGDTTIYFILKESFRRRHFKSIVIMLQNVVLIE